MDDEDDWRVESSMALAPIETRLRTPPGNSKLAEVTVSVLQTSPQLSSAHLERRTRHWRHMAASEDDEPKAGEEEARRIQTPPIGGILLRDIPKEKNALDSAEETRSRGTPPLPTIGMREGTSNRVKSERRSRGSVQPLGPSLELKKAWKTEAIQRLAKMERPHSILDNSDTSSVMSLEDLKRRIAERPSIVVMMNNRRARGDLSYQRELRRSSIPAGSQDPLRRRRSRSLTPNRDDLPLSSQQRRSSSSSDPSSLKSNRLCAGDLPGHLDRSMSKSNPLSCLESSLREETAEEVEPSVVLSAASAMYERRRSIASSLMDSTGNLSYASRKSLRRGSLADAITERPNRLLRLSESSYPGEDRRQSLSLGRRRGSQDVVSSGVNSLSIAGELGSMALRPPQGSLGRRRRSRAPASLAEDISKFAERQKRRISGLKRFRRAAKVVQLCVSMCQKSFLRAEKEKEVFMSLDSTSGLLDGQRLLFDPAYFKADRQQRLSEETKRILNLSPEERTDDLIKYIEIALRNIRAFAQYPLRMQHKLCKVGWLEEYESKRAILRQGHSPHGFYFILSGEVIVTVLDTKKGKRVAETVATLKRGESFGELAILNRTQRASTVISQDRVELLVISVEDFEDIFMLSGGIKKVNDPDQHAFLTSLACLKHWPLQLIEKHPKDCRFHFFKDGNVLIKDSLFSEWIYIIKSGSCSVLKKLKRVSPSIPSRLKRKTSPVTGNNGSALALPSAADTSDHTLLSPIKKRLRRHKRNHTWPSIKRPGREVGPPGADDARLGLRSDTGTRRDSTAVDGSTVMPGQASRTLQRNPRKGMYLTTARDFPRIATLNKENKEVKFQAGSEENSDEEQSDVELETAFVQRRREFHSDLDSTRMPLEKTEADMDPMFVVVQVLTKGAVFGLTGVVFSDQPSLSLVSNGAECIVINKKFYLEHATDETLRTLRKEEVPYPSEDELQSKLQQYMNWNAYRHNTFFSTLYDSRDHKTDRVQVTKSIVNR